MMLSIERLGHTFFRLKTGKGLVILIDPWIVGNPVCPPSWQEKERYEDVGVILLSHAHFDHSAGLRDVLAANPKAVLVAVPEVHALLSSPQNLDYWKGGNWSQEVIPYVAQPINMGGEVGVKGIKIAAVTAAHSAGYAMDQAPCVYGGNPVGFVLTLEDGMRLYYAGDTGLTADMRYVVGEVFSPDITIVPVDGVFNMTPALAARAGQWTGAKVVIPCHYFPRAEDLEDPNVADRLRTFLKEHPCFAASVGREKIFLQNYKDLTGDPAFILELGAPASF